MGLLAASTAFLAAAAGGAQDLPQPQRSAAPSVIATNATPTAKSSALESPSPAIAGKSTGKPEEAHLAQLDTVVAPLRDYDLSPADAGKLRDAFAALFANNVTKATGIKSSIGDPLAAKLIDWYRLRQGHGEAAEYRAFLDQNPDWPSRELLRRRMEELLFASGGSTRSISDYFKDGEPESAAGLAVLASVHLAHGDKEKAKALAAKVWREHDLSPELEHGFLARFGSLLTQEDHKWRLDRLLVENVKWKNGRNERAALARRVIDLLPTAEQTKAKARLSVFLHTQAGKSGLSAASDAKAGDWGAVFHKIQQLRRSEKLEAAAKLMLGAPTDPVVVVNLDDWWAERQNLAYQALKANKPKLAYDLVREAGPLSVNPLNEQTFMAGWIALRYLKDADIAQKHFAALAKTADGPLSRSKTHYWLGRTAEVKGDRDTAMKEYRIAAQQTDTFHGLLAMQKLDPKAGQIAIEPPSMPTPAQIERVHNLDTAKALALARKAGLSIAIQRIFLRHLATLEGSEGWSAMVAHLAHRMGDTQTAVQIGKAAIARGQNLIYYSYPVQALPQYTPLRSPPETAFLLGVARQETEFNPLTISSAGARGILQVMKVTANHVCRDYKIKCNHDKLLSDPSYNTMIASAYIADRMAEFSGSYVLGLSSYNAGPGRTRQWIREFGDPRRANVDPIDWIERIPFEETRRYVGKVLSNIQIYRARLGEPGALRLEQDLTRAREASLSPQQRKTDTAKSGN